MAVAQVCLSLQSKVTIVLLPLLGVMDKKQTDLLASAHIACSQCRELEGTDINFARARQAGPRLVTPSYGILPTCRDTDTGMGREE